MLESGKKEKEKKKVNCQTNLLFRKVVPLLSYVVCLVTVTITNEVKALRLKWCSNTYGYINIPHEIFSKYYLFNKSF